MIFGGGFVGEFVGDTPWIHLDIAGTSDATSAHDWPKVQQVSWSDICNAC